MLTAELEAYETEVGDARVALSRMAAMEDKLAAYEDQIRRFSEVLSGKDNAARDLEAEIDSLNRVIEELQVHLSVTLCRSLFVTQSSGSSSFMTFYAYNY